MISRQSYLHIAFENDVRRFHEYAPMNVTFPSVVVDQTEMDEVCNHDDEQKQEQQEQGRGGQEKGTQESGDGSTNSSRHSRSTNEKNENSDPNPYPKCWFEDEQTGLPLRWQLFVGIIYDFLKMQHQQQQHQQQHSSSFLLPWKIRIHFTSYPEHTILPIDHDENVKEILFRQYRNAFKQALFIQHNSNKIVNNMTKQNHLQLWDGIQRNQYQVYNEVSMRLNRSGTSSGGTCGDSSSSTTTSHNTFGGNKNMTLEKVPVRVMVDSRPAFARPCHCTFDSEGDDGNEQTMMNKRVMSLGDILHNWLPELFITNSKTGSIEASSGCLWCVQGIQLTLSTSISDAWKCLCHPDRFLYVIIVTK